MTMTHRLAAAVMAAGALLGGNTLLAATTPAPAAEQPLSSLPYTPSLDPAAMDRSVAPCEDLYQYACGGWIEANPIPADQSSWSVYAKLANENQRFLWGVLEQLAQPVTPEAPARSARQTQLGDYFAACMDEAAVQKAGLAPLQPALARIAALQDKRQLPALLAALQLDSGSDRFFFGFGAGQDFADATQQIAFATAGGLSLPERAYYLKADARSVALRQQFLAHVARLFELLGDSPAAATLAARSVLSTETALAKASLSTVDKRDPYKTFHTLDARGLQRLTPGFDWTAYRIALGVPAALDRYNVTEPAFFKALGAQWQRTSLAQIKTYLRWQLASSSAPTLDAAVAQADFDFFSHTLRGVPQQKPRWKRCVQWADQQLGESLGQEFVARTFGPEQKAATQQMTAEIEAAMASRLKSLSWMSEPTRQRALAKLNSIVNKVGYPDRWRDYSALKVSRDDFFGNVRRGKAFELRRQLVKIGQPLDRGEWGMTPQTVNAYYDAQMNDINFPAAVLQPPLYDPQLDDAPNYGNTGGTIGHELIHGFDDEGRQFDAQGNLKDWWQPQDAKAFEARAACVAKQYAGYTIVDNIKINPQLTLGEDLADFGGMVLAWQAWQSHVAGQPLGEVDGLTPAQRFFVGFAQWDCNSTRPETLRLHALTDPHSPGRHRINGVVVNLPQFEQAFACKPGQKMVLPAAQRCALW
jgi:putative endopeptidase